MNAKRKGTAQEHATKKVLALISQPDSTSIALG